MAKKEKPAPAAAAAAAGIPAREKAKELGALFFVLCSMFVLIALATFDAGDVAGVKYPVNQPVRNKAGAIGAHVGYFLLRNFGLAAYLVALLAGFWSFSVFFRRRVEALGLKLAGAVITLLAGAALLSLQPVIGAGSFGLEGVAPGAGGVYGKAMELVLVENLGTAGAFLAVLLAFSLSAVLATDWVLYVIAAKAASWGWSAAQRWIRRDRETIDQEMARARREIVDRVQTERRKLADELAALPSDEEADEEVEANAVKIASLSKAATVKLPPDPAERIRPVTEEKAAPEAKPAKKDEPRVLIPRNESTRDVIKQVAEANPKPKSASYEQPPIDLFEKSGGQDTGLTEGEIHERMTIIENTLQEFDIASKCVNYEIGPATTTFELELAPGTTCSSVGARADELTMKLAVPPVRVVAPIPGKSTVGVEVPNPIAEIVRMRSFLEKNYADLRKIPLPIILGKTNSGEAIVKSLTSMPHLLIGGSTGSGKSVCLNTIITTLAISMSWDEMKLILIDPKRVELAAFADIPHLWAPVVDDARRAAQVLEWLIKEMEERYGLLKQVKARNIDTFNRLGEKGVRERLIESGASEEDVTAAPTFLPYIVVVIDEMANLMQTARKEVELSISTLAAKARAIGIHLICATQRPSADVVTGLIKANMPSRIGFRVSSAVESRIILDNKGAERLLGKGDMLTLMAPNYTLVRGQCTYTSDEEIRGVAQFLKSKAKPVYHEELMELDTLAAGEGTADDELFEEAVQVVLQEQRASTSFLQRKFKVGYSRAARLIETMEKFGIVGRHSGANPREILVTWEQWESMKRRQPEQAEA